MPTYFDRMHKDLEHLRNRLFGAMYEPVAELEVEGWRTSEPVPFSKRTSGKAFTPRTGKPWGKLFDCAWFRLTGKVPDAAKGRRVVLLVDLGGEGLVVDDKGQPLRGLTNKFPGNPAQLHHPLKRVVQFAGRARGGEKVDVWIDAGLNSLFGDVAPWGDYAPPCVAVCHTELRALYYDFEVMLDMMHALPEHSAQRHQFLTALCEVDWMMRTLDEPTARAARKILAPHLARRAGDPTLHVTAAGHAHIDLAWLWPLRETYRKGARTFATTLELMDRYPDYRFSQSMPQLYQWMKEMYPGLYRRIKRKVAEGRWEPLGALWVECDTNVPGGESLVRQLLYGKRFFREEFGVDSRVVFLPDSFGYSGALPQLMRLAGVDLFITQKLSWDRFKDYPHHSFLWRGIDGSGIATHLLPEDNYNSSATPASFIRIEKEYIDKGVSDQALMAYGIGDGGGGPGAEHLERLERIKGLAGLPEVQLGSVEEFRRRFLKDLDRFESWIGELYLSCHQGTYTTQAKNKRGNRKLEWALRETEWTAALAGLLTGARYPRKELGAIWREMLLLQFHDILPGSSITRVHEESQARYEALLKQAGELLAASRGALARTIDGGTARKPAVVFNSFGWPRREWMQHDGRWLFAEIPPMGYTVVDLTRTVEESAEVMAGPDELENELLRVTFSRDGAIESIYDKEHEREVVGHGGRANEFAVYDDPGDAWDFVIQYERQTPARFELQSTDAHVEGPRAEVRQVRRHGASTLRQTIALTAGSRRIDFITEVDWHESNRMLRVAFPTSVFAPQAACEIQFGNILRPTHRNAVWEQSMFEVSAHKWIDLADRGYGVALLNDCKYGFKLVDNVIDMNLLRSPGHPDPVADRGTHRFSYALLPHGGDYVVGGVIREAYAFNHPLTALPLKSAPSKLPHSRSFIQISRENVVIETMKRAEDDDAMILRLYEATGASTRARLSFSFKVAAVEIVDLLEENPRRLKLHRGGEVELTFRPFEVLSLRVTPAG